MFARILVLLIFERHFMELVDFQKQILLQDTDEKVLDFCRKHILHGTPFVYNEREEEYYEFRKIIANEFKIPFHEIYITGSGKLGYSPFKDKIFDLDSDIDVALISASLFEEIMKKISSYQMEIRRSRASITSYELKMYHEFLEYVAIGWIRPDKLPVSFKIKTLKDNWFGFFKSLSNGRSSVGNYKVAAGVFQSFEHLETYLVDGLIGVRTKYKLRKPNDSAD